MRRRGYLVETSTKRLAAESTGCDDLGGGIQMQYTLFNFFSERCENNQSVSDTGLRGVILHSIDSL